MSQWRDAGISQGAGRAIRRAAVAASAALLVATAVGCRALPLAQIDDPAAIELRLLGLRSTRTLVRGQTSRFFLRVTNRSEVPVELDQFSVTLVAERDDPPTRLYSSTWTYHWAALDQSVTIGPQKYMEIPVAPERKEFALDQQRPGIYRVRAIVDDRFESPPIEVRVLDPYERRVPRPPPGSPSR